MALTELLLKWASGEHQIWGGGLTVAVRFAHANEHSRGSHVKRLAARRPSTPARSTARRSMPWTRSSREWPCHTALCDRWLSSKAMQRCVEVGKEENASDTPITNPPRDRRRQEHDHHNYPA